MVGDHDVGQGLGSDNFTVHGRCWFVKRSAINITALTVGGQLREEGFSDRNIFISDIVVHERKKFG